MSAALIGAARLCVRWRLVPLVALAAMLLYACPATAQRSYDGGGANAHMIVASGP